jgi:hypothetical protein
VQIVLEMAGPEEEVGTVISVLGESEIAMAD